MDTITPPETKKRGRPKKIVNPDEEVKSSGDSAPKRSAQKIKSTKPWTSAVQVENALNTYLVLVGFGVSKFNEYDGKIILTNADNLSHELVELAKEDRALRVYLEALAKPSKYGGLIIAVGGIVLPILMNHHLVPTMNLSSLGIETPDVDEVNQEKKTESGEGVTT